MHAEQSEFSRRARLFLLSLVSLYLEILIIRWVESEIRIFAYFKNLALIAAFLGLGVGYVARKPRLSLRWCAGGLFLLAFLLHPNVHAGSFAFRQISDYLAFEDRQIWYLTPVGALLVAKGFLMLAALFLLVAGTDLRPPRSGPGRRVPRITTPDLGLFDQRGRKPRRDRPLCAAEQPVGATLDMGRRCCCLPSFSRVVARLGGNPERGRLHGVRDTAGSKLRPAVCRAG